MSFPFESGGEGNLSPLPSQEAASHGPVTGATQHCQHVTFTLRAEGTLIRIISARPMSQKERLRRSKKLRPIPKFRNEREERGFWECHDSTDYVDWSKAQRVRFPNLKPSTTAISLRLPLSLLESIKIEANERDVPYQSLIKTWLAERAG